MDEDRIRMGGAYARIKAGIQSMAAVTFSDIKGSTNCIQRRIASKSKIAMGLMSCKSLSKWALEFLQQPCWNSDDDNNRKFPMINQHMVIGDWFRLTKSETSEIEVLVGQMKINPKEAALEGPTFGVVKQPVSTMNNGRDTSRLGRGT